MSPETKSKYVTAVKTEYRPGNEVKNGMQDMDEFFCPDPKKKFFFFRFQNIHTPRTACVKAGQTVCESSDFPKPTTNGKKYT